MRTIIRIQFGSHLYGTATPASDLDFKSVFVPQARDILLQRVKGSISTKRAKAEREKNVAGDIDEEAYSLQRFLGLVAEGQTVSLDVLFAPPAAWIGTPSIEWREITDNRHRLLSRKASAFIGYARQQANKYGIKGSRVAAARHAAALIDRSIAEIGTTTKLRAIEADVRKLAAGTEHMNMVDIPQASGETLPHWEVCGRKFPFSASLKSAKETLDRLIAEYGHRALQAESQQGVDWKALSHAVRVGEQAIELLRTGHITFPLLNADHIKAIKLGERLYQDVAAEIEDLLARIEAAAAESSLPAEPDTGWIDAFVEGVYRGEVCHG